MFWSFQNEDPFNNNKMRTFENTPTREYNCAGFALKTFSWYCPFDEPTFIEGNENELQRLENLAISTLIRDFDLAYISASDVRAKFFNINRHNLIAFRFSNSDFHFWRLDKDMQWHEKRGGTCRILTHSYNDVWEEWHGGYDRHIYFYLQKRK